MLKIHQASSPNSLNFLTPLNLATPSISNPNPDTTSHLAPVLIITNHPRDILHLNSKSTILTTGSLAQPVPSYNTRHNPVPASRNTKPKHTNGTPTSNHNPRSGKSNKPVFLTAKPARLQITLYKAQVHIFLRSAMKFH